MSLALRAINLGLRLFEKPHLARVADPQSLRDGFERRARLLSAAPRSARMEDTAVGLRVELGPTDAGTAILHFHGGGYIFGSSRTHAGMMACLSERTGMPAFLPDYRLAPEHPFPAATEDARTAYAQLLASGIPPERIVIGGDSAGGGLALSLLGDLLAKGQPVPAAVYAMSPLTDLTFSGPSVTGNAQADPMLPASRASHMAEMYLQGADPRTPAASPLFADFSGAPPVWFAVSSTEILRDDTLRIAERMRDQGVGVHTHVLAEAPHVWPFFHRWMPEARETLDELAGWIRQQLPQSAGN